MKDFIGYFIGFLSVIALIIVLLFTSVDIAAFNDMDFFREQYRKNNVYDQINIDEGELMRVTDELLGYMKDKRSDLNIVATIDGKEIEFFNQREKDHMIDVKNLVLGGINIRRMLIIFIFASIALISILKLDVKRVLSRCIVFGFPFVACVFGALGIIISKDFYSAFIKFHELLFTNDLWYLNPDTDRLLMIVPEPFFSSVTLKIGLTFAAMVFIVYIFALIIFLKCRNKKKVSF